MELAFAGLHQLCAPMLDHAESLPVPQREALRTAFGLSAGPVPDRFLVGLAVLGLLSETAGERPLICVVDDMQWLDHASAQALGFAARRLGADPVGLMFAARVPGQDVAGLPELVVGGLGERDARELLESVLTGPLDARVRDRIIAARRSRSRRVMAVTRPRSCSARPNSSRRWTPGWPARPTWRRSRPRCSSAVCHRRSGTWPEPHVWRPRHWPRRAPPICSWTAWLCWSRRAMRPGRPF